MIGLHSALAIVLLVMSQASYFNAPWGRILGVLNELGDTLNRDVIIQSAYTTFQTLLSIVPGAYGLCLVLTFALLIKPTRRLVISIAQSAVLVVMLLAMLLAVNRDMSGEIRVDQPIAFDVEFAWQTRGECVEYRFAAQGAREVWLGEEGLASFEPMNYGSYCDSAPRLLRIITSDGQEHRYLVGRLWSWSSLDAWWWCVAAALLLPTVLIFAEKIAQRLQVVDETHFDTQEAR
ncbi:MAG: hypothetical protein RML73_10240 [Anaerolineae bacterium]|nr:hypothetical protein [Anaerolineae bacterium]